MTPLAQAISRALIHFVWQGSILGLLLWAVLFVLRKRSATARYAASCAALGVMAWMPIATTAFIYSRQIAVAMRLTAGAHSASANTAGFVPFYSVQPAWFSWLQIWALPMWSLGVFIFSVRLMLGYKHAFALRRCGKPAGESVREVVVRLTRLMGIHRPVQVLLSSIADTPSVVGWLRPVILLPAATLMGLTPLQLEAVLAHEIGHIKRYDYLINIIQMVVETLLFYHPAVWWISKHIRIERELCCDDLAVQFSGNALRYARALTRLEKLRLRAPSVVMASTGGPLLHRIQRLAGVTAKEYGPSRLPAILAVSLGAICFVLNITGVRGQDAPGVQVDLRASRVMHRTPVPYPAVALKQNLTGTVQLEVKLDKAGNVADARVLTGPEELRKTALESVLNWHFTSDAAGGTRLITISFSDTGKQVRVLHPVQHVRATVNAVGDAEPVMIGGSTLVREQEQNYIWVAKMADQAQLTERESLAVQIAAMKAKLQASESVTADQRREMELKLNELKEEKLLASPPKFVTHLGERSQIVKIGPAALAGRTVKAIGTGDLPEAIRHDLLSRLPIREGDTLSPDSIKQIAQAVHAFDEHFKVQFRATDTQVEIRIIVPGSDRQ